MSQRFTYFVYQIGLRLGQFSHSPALVTAGIDGGAETPMWCPDLRDRIGSVGLRITELAGESLRLTIERKTLGRVRRLIQLALDALVPLRRMLAERGIAKIVDRNGRDPLRLRFAQIHRVVVRLRLGLQQLRALEHSLAETSGTAVAAMVEV